MGMGEKSLGFLLNRASWAAANMLKDNFIKEGLDLPHSQYIVLRLLYEQEGLSQQQIAETLHKDSAAIKRTLDILERKELIVRKPVSLCKYNIYLTPDAIEQRDKIISIADKTIQKALEGISEQQYKEIVAFLNHIYEQSVK